MSSFFINIIENYAISVELNSGFDKKPKRRDIFLPSIMITFFRMLVYISNITLMRQEIHSFM